MSTPSCSAADLVHAEATAGSSDAASGALIDGCAIDLPSNDVVEAIDFERFFMLNVRLQEFQRPVTLMSAWISMSEGISVEDVAKVAPELARGAPLSLRRQDWETLVGIEDRQTNALRGSALEEAGDTSTASPAEGGMPDIGGYNLAFYLPYRQEWNLLGYSKGRMVSSLTLGPEEEQTIEIFKWDRLSRTLDSTTSYELEQTNESSGTRRDTTDVSREISRQAGFELTSDAKVGFSVEMVNADFSAGMNARTGLNDAENNAWSSITEATSRAATNVRTSRTLKVVETRESGQETRVTRKLRNHNTCHTLTTSFFEILANYEVSTQLKADAIRIVVLLKSSDLSELKAFDRRLVRSHERALTLALLDSTLAPGFEAARYLDARDRACSILCAGCDCGHGTTEGAEGDQWQELKTSLAALGTAAASLSGYRVIFPLSVGIAVIQLPSGPRSGAFDIKRHTFMKALARHAPRLLTDLGGLGLATGSATPAIADSAMAIIDAIGREHLDALSTPERSVTDAVMWEIFGALFVLSPGDPIVKAITAGIQTGVLIAGIGGLTYNDAGLVSAIVDVRAKYAAWQGYLAEQRAKDEELAERERIAAEERAARVLDAFPLQATAEALERLEALLDHLNDGRNIDHYRFAVWNERAGSTDPQLLALALAGFTEGAPVGVVGDQLAVPVRIPPGSALETFFKESIADLVAMSPRDDDDHILPTAALYAEAIPGKCSACEPNRVRAEELDLVRRELENSLVKAEADRLAARLAAKELDGPAETAPIKVELVGTSQPSGGGTPEP